MPVWRYNEMSRPDIGLIRGQGYISMDERMANFSHGREVKIIINGNGHWVLWCCFTKMELTQVELTAMNLQNKRDRGILSILG